MPHARKAHNEHGERQCCMCERWLPPEAFHRSKKSSDGRGSNCKECMGEYRRGWCAENRDRAAHYSRKYRLKRDYGLTIEEYEALIAKGCAICGSHETIYMDHNHRNGKVRAALCRNCNTAIGYAHDDPSILRAAAEYLEQWQKEHAQ